MNLCGQEEAVEHATPGVYEKGLYDAYWHERNLTRHAANVTVPVLYSQGFADEQVFPVEAIGWFNELQGPKRAFIHQGEHQYPSLASYAATERAWFDHWLKGIGSVPLTPLVQVESNLGVRTDDEWPPAGVAFARSYLAPGALAATAPAVGEASYVAGVPRLAAPIDRPVTISPPHPIPRPPFLGSPVAFVAHTFNSAVDAAVLAATGHPTNLSYVGPPLDAPLHMAGSARIHLRASSEATNTYLLCSLYDVHGDVWTEVTTGWMNAHLREGFDRSAPREPGVVHDFAWSFEPDEHVFQPGHRVGLKIFGGDPRAWPGEPPGTVNTVEHGASFLELPILGA